MLYANYCSRCFKSFMSRRSTDAVCQRCADERARLNSHRDDPDPAHEAAQRMEASGTAADHRGLVMAALSRHPDGLTGPEAGEESGLGHIEAQRRLSDLCRDGEVEKTGRRPCRIKGSSITVWRLVNRDRLTARPSPTEPSQPHQGVLI